MRKSLIFLMLLSFFLLPSMVIAYPDAIQSTKSLSQPVEELFLSPNSRYIFATSSSSTAMTVFDTLIFQEVATYAVGYAPYDMVISADGSLAYVVSGKADSIIVLDLSDPEEITESEVISVGTSGSTFRKVESGTLSGALYLYLADQSNKKIYIYNVTDDVLVDSSNNPINLGFSPVDIKISPDGTKISALSSAGKFHVFNSTDFTAFANEFDVGAASPNFLKFEVGSVPDYGEVAFLLNSDSTGEIFLVDMSTVALIDADPDGDDDPIEVGSTPKEIGLTTVNNPDSGDSTGFYIYCSVGTDVKVIDTKGIGSDTLEPFATISAAGDIETSGIEAGSASDGYGYFGASDEQAIKVISDNPQITFVSPTGNVSIESGSQSIKFSSDVSGTYKVVSYTGSASDGISSSLGTSLGSGSLTADEEITISVSVDDLVEGQNFIVVFVTADDLTGRAGFKIDYDTTPSVPENFNVEFGNEKILVSFDRNSESDMDYYNLYFGLSESDLSGADGVESPVVIDHPSSGNKVYYTLSGLTNGVEYFLAVSAVDETGNESERTEVSSEIPEKTLGPIELSGETGGCGNAGGSMNCLSVLIFAVFICVLLLSGSRSTIFIIIPFVVLTTPLYAGEEKEIDAPETSEKYVPMTLDSATEDETPPDPQVQLTQGKPSKTRNFFSTSLRILWFMPSNSILKTFYGAKGNEMFGFKSTFLVWLLELGFGMDFLYEKARMIGETTGRSSGEKASLFMMPISFPVHFNFRFIKPQILVPYGKLGYSIVYYRIKEPDSKVSGWGNNFIVGSGLKFEFENLTGTGDSKDTGLSHIFLFFEWIYSHHFKSGVGLSFSGHSWGFGLGADY